MPQMLSALALLVRDYDEAIDFFVGTLGFELLEDTTLGAATPEQVDRIGDQTGGRVFLFLETDDFRRDYERLAGRGVRFIETPREEPYGKVVVFEDLYGNRWDLVQRRVEPGDDRY